MKLTYTAPTARDLSTLSVQGGPDYVCAAGLIADAPPAGCTSGASAGATCTTGMFVTGSDLPCTSGASPTTGECVTGTGAANASCTSGTTV